MKKLSSFALALCFLFFLPALSFAVTTIDSNGGQGTTDIVKQFKTSNNVNLYVIANKTTYAATCDHLNGDKVYGSSAGDSVIYFQKKTDLSIDTGQHYDTGPSRSDSGAFTASGGWENL